VAVLGANGAGKTTLVKLMCGLLRPTAGGVELLGTEPIHRRIAVRRQMGLVLAGRVRLWPELTPHDNFELLYALYGLHAAEHAGRTARLAELLGVAGDLQTQVRKLSFGTRTKLELMGGLLHAPRVVFLDESPPWGWTTARVRPSTTSWAATNRMAWDATPRWC
jgi:ABC-2 type transport system ATP-binding protein